MALLRAENLAKIYRTKAETIRALSGVNLEIKTGDFIIINGPSGSGKTTFLNLICGIDTPSNGEVYINDTPLSSLSDEKKSELRRDRIGLIFQSFELIPVLTAGENVEYPLLLQGVGKEERRKRVGKILEEVGLSELTGRFPAQLSGGQKQRVAIARALVTKAEVVLADEPTGNLDSETGEQIMRLLRDLNENSGVAFIIVTHDLSLNRYAKKLWEIKDGILSVKEDRTHVEDCLA